MPPLSKKSTRFRHPYLMSAIKHSFFCYCFSLVDLHNSLRSYESGCSSWCVRLNLPKRLEYTTIRMNQCVYSYDTTVLTVLTSTSGCCLYWYRSYLSIPLVWQETIATSSVQRLFGFRLLIGRAKQASMPLPIAPPPRSGSKLNLSNDLAANVRFRVSVYVVRDLGQALRTRTYLHTIISFQSTTLYINW